MSWGRKRSDHTRYHHRRLHPPDHCAQCGTTDTPLIQDHIINLAAHGEDTVDNMQWLCPTCHTTKSEAERRQGITRRSGKRKPRAHPADAYNA
jgi:hypothetical protein